MFDERTLLIDGEILVYRPCCIWKEDTDEDRKLIAQNVDKAIADLTISAGCTSYEIFLTTRKNFRHWLVDDYKANRLEVDRPVNLVWAKKHMMEKHGAVAVPYLEADDLLSINQTKDTVIWSLDKDLMQVPGWHLVDGELEEVFYQGAMTKKGSKYSFNGFKGLMFQALTGDTADYIIGCGIRKQKTYKSGKKKGQKHIAREGVGPALAFSILKDCSTTLQMKEAVRDAYRGLYGDSWQVEMEKQVNLLYMVTEHKAGFITQWTYDGRDSIMDITTGKVHDNAD